MADLYAMMIPGFIRTLQNLEHCIAKAAASGIDGQQLVTARLVDDMLPFTKQVQIASDTARFAAARVGQAEPLAIADDETTLAQLAQRLARTVAYLQAVDPAGFADRDDAEVILKLPNGEMKFTGLSYAIEFAVPNFYFHATMVYALLRINGVAVGKMDFLAGAAAPQ